jgi:hypothetical protein
MARTKGAKNKMTIAIKDAVQRCFETVNIDNAYLLDLAVNEKTLFVSLISKCIPNQVALDIKVQLDLGQAMIENQANLDRMKVIAPVIENEVGTEPDSPKIPEPKPLKTNDNKTDLP